MSQKCQFSFFPDIISSENLYSNYAHQMEEEENQKCCEGLSQCEASVQSVGSKDRMFGICPVSPVQVSPVHSLSQTMQLQCVVVLNSIVFVSI